MRPRSVAVVGASTQPGSVGERPIRYLKRHGYKGRIYPINPKYSEIAGLTCYPSLLAVPQEIDLTLLAVSVDRTFQVLEDCVQKGVRTATVFASGFAESGGEGVALQARIKAFCRATGLRVCGPNCIGTINIKDGIAATFSNVAEREAFIPGAVGLVSQSGGLAGSILDRAQDKGLGLSFVVSAGNEADLEVADYIDFMLSDSDTRVIMAFVEGFKNGVRLREVAARALEIGKPLVILKAGRSEKGKRAAVSHTGSLAGSDEIIDALFRQKGVIRVNDLDELVDTASFLALSPLPEGNRIGVLSLSGGAGVIMGDKCEENGLDLVDFSPNTKEALRRIMPSYGNISNPFDPTAQGYGGGGSLEVARFSLETLLGDETLDTIVAQLPTVSGEHAASLAREVGNSRKLARGGYAALCTAGASSEPAHRVFQQSGIAYFTSFTNCFKAIRAGYTYSRRLKTRSIPATLAIPPGTSQAASKYLETMGATGTEYESKALLSLYGIAVTAETLTTNLTEAVAAANRIGYPVALKVQSPDIPHKTEAGVIRLGINNADEVAAAYSAVLDSACRWNPRARVLGVLVQEMVPLETEALVGMVTDAQFGPVIAFGLGGVFVEVLRDMAYRPVPLCETDAREMIEEIKGYRVLQGVRGKPPADVEALVDVLLRLSCLATDLHEGISQIDVNPLAVMGAGRGVKAVDALVVKRQDQG